MSGEQTDSPNDPELSDDEIRHALSHLEFGAASPDEAALQEIRAEVRARVMELRKSTSTDVGDDSVRLRSQPADSRTPHPKARSFSRAVATLVSALVLLLMALFIDRTEAQDVPSLGALLGDLKGARSVAMDVKREDESVQIHVQAPGTVRWTEDARHYRVADGHRLWQVELDDENRPTVTVRPSPIPADGTDALKLLGLGGIQTDTLIDVQPAGFEELEGITCRTYTTGIEVDDGPARLTALASEESGELVLLRLTRALADGSRHMLAEARFRESTPADDLFAVRRSLRDDGRMGTISDVHGLVFVRSFPGHRWTPASPSLPLFAGDQIRCDARGANAAVVRLTQGTTLTLGPSGQMTLSPGERIQLEHGDLQVQPATRKNPPKAGDGAVVTLTGPAGNDVDIAGPTVVRATSAPPGMKKLSIVPPWLKTLEGNLTTETMGSLVAQVDNKDTSLSIGFHHVSVEIRDQIARTVIEESFVNNTGERLEGVFHFPLPHDASISGFGMWIGDQLIEADVVEKQRAREIYETIKREKRDPGLLEWAGGNVFKARVFPIEPYSEKRIRIVYTQTLPLQNRSFRYSYALRSELLQQTPLKDLSLDVTVHSAVPLGSVRSPSHAAAEIQSTRHSASLKYSARDISPDRDFELLCSFEGRGQEVVAIPHVRGDDGYMMVQLSPPSVGGGNWSRTLVRDSTPLNVVLLCDTSRSMDETARRQQSELVSAILGSLSEADSVRLACCDVSCDWLQRKPVGVTDDVRERLIAMLEKRRSLGWSSLQLTFEEVLKQTARDTHVIYIGDGTVVHELSEASAKCIAWLNGTALKADRSVASGRRKKSARGIPTMHGIAVGNTFDMNVIRAIGRVGRGTSRTVAGSESPVAVARQLLFEITRPGLKDLSVEFRNVQVAAVYPAELPNLADGMQHILTGRFRPAENNKDAQIVVTGRRGDEDVRYVARMPLNVAMRESVHGGAAHDTRSSTKANAPIAGSGADQNSFIPRLWAKAHLDHLLMESATEEIQKRIIALSKTYHIITPYTSLLVLETDADRKRFGVERSMQMRDGEEFFAEGRKEAEYSLRQQQLAEAKLYRQQLYAQYRLMIQRLAATAFPLQPPAAPPRNRGLRLNRRGLGADRFYDGFFFHEQANEWSEFGRNYGRGGSTESLAEAARQMQGLPIVEGFNGRRIVQPNWYYKTPSDMHAWDVDMDGIQNAQWFAPAFGIPRSKGVTSHTVRNFFLTDPQTPQNHFLGYDTNYVTGFGVPPGSQTDLNMALREAQLLNESRDLTERWGIIRGYEPAFRLGDLAGGRRFERADGRGLGEHLYGDLITDGTVNTLNLYDELAGFEGVEFVDGRSYDQKYLRRATLNLFGTTPTIEAADEMLREREGVWLNNAGVPIMGKNLYAVRDEPRTLPFQPILVEPPTFGVSNVLPQVNAAEPDFAPWPAAVRPLFPAIVHAGEAPERPDDSSQREYPNSDWPKEVTDALRSFEQSFHDLERGLNVESASTDLHAVSGELSSEKRMRLRWAAEIGWLQELPAAKGPLLRWSVDDVSGAWLPAFRTGRTSRHPHPPKRAACMMMIPGLSAMMAEWTSAHVYSAEIVRRDERRLTILLTHRLHPWKQRRLTFDPARRCVLRNETLQDGRVTHIVNYEDHVQIESLWLPQRVTQSAFEPLLKGTAPVRRTRFSWRSVGVEELRDQIEKQIAVSESGLMIDGFLPGREETAEAIAAGKAGFKHQLARVFEHIHFGRWDEALAELDSALTDHGQLRNGHWLRWAVLLSSPEKEKLRQELSAVLADSLQAWAVWPKADDVGETDVGACRVAVLDHLHSFCEPLMSRDSHSSAVRSFNRLLKSLDASRDMRFAYMTKLVELLDQARRYDDAMKVRRQIVELWPGWLNARRQYLAKLVESGSREQIQAEYEMLLRDGQLWNAEQWNSLFVEYVNWQRGQGEFAAGLQICERWTKLCPFAAGAWEHLLRSLIELDRPDDVRQQRDQWLSAVLQDSVDPATALSPVVKAKFDAAFNFGFGKMAGLSLAGPQHEVRPQMLQTADRFAASDRNIAIADRVLSDKSFVREPDGRALLKRLLTRTAAEIDQISDERLKKVFTWLERSGVSGCDEHNALLSAMRAVLEEHVNDLDRDRLSILMLTWGAAFDEHTPKEQSQRWLDSIVRRWETAEEQRERDGWANFITQYETQTFDSEHQLAWHRKYFRECRDVRKPSAALALSTALLAQPWTKETEDETWSLISVMVPDPAPIRDSVGADEDSENDDADEDRLTDEEKKALERMARLNVLLRRVPLVRTWTNGVLRGRTVLQQKSDKKWEERSPSQQEVLQQHFRVAAVRAIVKVLNRHIAAAVRDEAGNDDPRLARLSSWLTIQRLTLEQELSRSQIVAGVSDKQKRGLKEKLIRDLRALLPKVPVTTPDPNDTERSPVEHLSNSIQLNARHWLLANWLQLGYELDDEIGSTHIDRILEYIRIGAATDTVAPRAWRAAEFGILVSIDRPDELEEKLRRWLKDDLPTAPWRRHLGHLLAELDRLDEATRLYESAGRKDLLSAGDWKLLSVWQHALDRRADMEESLWQEWRHTSTGDKHTRLQNELNEWKNNTTGRTPTAPADVIRRLAELLDSDSSNKESLLSAKRWYLSTHDPLVLRAVGSCVTGRSRAKMLETVAWMQSLINDIDQETGIDMVYESLARASRRVAANDSRSTGQKRIDRIGLKFFELQAAAHASKIKDQPGPHVDRCIAAIQAIAAVPWYNGERTAVAERLSNLGKLNDRELQRVRFDAALGLLGVNNEGTSDRLGVALRCAQIARFDERPDRAIEILESELQTYTANASAWSSEAGKALDQLIRRYHEQKRFLQSERLLVDIADKLDVDHIRERIWKTRVAALEEGGRTLLGEGQELYAELRDAVWDNVVNPERSADFGPAWSKIQQILYAGRKAKIRATVADVKRLAAVVDKLIRRHSGQHAEIVERLFVLQKENVGVRASVEFLLTRLRSQPVALQWTQPRSAWNNFADNLYEATWPAPKKKNQPREVHTAVRPIRDQVERAMFQGFETGLAARDDSQHYYFDRVRVRVYRRGTQRILDAVDRVVKADPDSEPHLIFVVRFLQQQFENHTAAARYLQLAFDRGLLSYNSQVRLADLYFRIENYQDGVTILRKIVETHSGVLDLRFKLMTGYSKLKDQRALNAELDNILENLVDPQEGSLSNLFKVADHCRICGLWKRGAELYDLAFQRRVWPTGPDPGLSAAWLSYAECLRNLNRTSDALDAVAAAWVICGRNSEYRKQSKEKLDEVLAGTDDLAGAAEHVARRAVESGEESSFLRRALGTAFLAEEEFAAAESHLRMALELQPGDRETRKALVKCFDGQQKSDDAVATLINWLEFEPRNIPVYEDLHTRFRKFGLKGQAERAATSIVETGVEESAHHWALAVLREKAGALPSAVAHWERAVDLRTDDPWPLVRLTEACLKAGDRLNARRSFGRLQAKEWDERFEKLPEKMKQLRKQLR